MKKLYAPYILLLGISFPSCTLTCANEKGEKRYIQKSYGTFSRKLPLSISLLNKRKNKVVPSSHVEQVALPPQGVFNSVGESLNERVTMFFLRKAINHVITRKHHR